MFSKKAIFYCFSLVPEENRKFIIKFKIEVILILLGLLLCAQYQFGFII